MRMVTIYLQTNGVASTQIKKEIFHVERPTRQPVPPDKDAHLVSIHTNHGEHTILVQYPSTILQAARRNGLHLPYSCESGQCGSCAVHCSAGQVWMYNNEVLTDEELAKGLILTCTAFPVGGPVTIRV
jgi:ring-1,2-phenylacetyl-CoA epoxidase subunit PaaE